MILFGNNIFAQNVPDMEKTRFQDNNFHTEDCPDRSYCTLSQVNIIPTEPRGNDAARVWGSNQIGIPTQYYRLEIIQYK